MGQFTKEELQILKDKQLALSQNIENINPSFNSLNIPDTYYAGYRSAVGQSTPTQIPVGDIFQQAGRSKFDEGTPAKNVLASEGIQDWRGEQQSKMDKIANGLFVRLPLTTVTKFAEMAGYTATSLDWAGSGDISTMTDNPFSAFFRESEEKLKEIFPIYYPKSVREGNLWDHITSTSFWMNEGTDAAAFFAAAMGTGYLTGGIAPGLQAAGLSGTAARNIGLGVATTLQTIGEAGTEAAHLGIEMRKEKEGLLQQYATELEMSGMSPEEIDVAVQQRNLELDQSIAEAQAGTFGANVGILIGPNILMNRMLFGKMFDSSPNIARRFIDDTADVFKANPMVTRREAFNRIAQNVGKGIVSEGFWEEGLQGSSSEYFKALAFGEEDRNIVEGILGTYLESLGDVDFQKGIFLGGVLGGLGGVRGALSETKSINAQVAAINDVVTRNPSTILETLVKNKEEFDISDPETFSKAITEVYEQLEGIASITKQDIIADLARLANKEDVATFAENSALLSWSYQLLNTEGGVDILNKQIDKLTEDAYNEYMKSPEATQDKMSFERHKQYLKDKVAGLQKIVDRVNNNYGEFLYGLENTNNLPTAEFNRLKSIIGRNVTYAQVNTLNNIDSVNKSISRIQTQITELAMQPQTEDVVKESERLTNIQGELTEVLDKLNKDIKILTDRNTVKEYASKAIDAKERIRKVVEDAIIDPENIPSDVAANMTDTSDNIKDIISQGIFSEDIQNEDGTTSTNTYTGEVELSFADKDGNLIEGTKRYKIDRINPDTGNLTLKELDGEVVSKRTRTLRADGTLTGDGAHKIVAGYNILKTGQQVKDEGGKPIKGPKPTIKPTIPVVAPQEDYGDTTYDVEFTPDPMEPFHNVGSFQRTTNAQHTILERGQRDRVTLIPNEPQLAFQEFVDTYDTSSGSRTLVGYTLAQMKANETLNNMLENNPEIKSQLGSFDTPESVYMVVSDTAGKPILKTSEFNPDRQIAMWAYMSEISQKDGEYINERPRSKDRLVDMKRIPEDLQDTVFHEAANKFYNDIRNSVIQSDNPVKFRITGKTPGKVNWIPGQERTAKNVTEVLNSNSVKDLTIEVASTNEIINKTTRIVQTASKGFVYFQTDGMIFSADRVTLNSKDTENVTRLVQSMVLNRGEEKGQAYTDAYKAVNDITFMTFASKENAEKYKGKEFSNFYVNPTTSKVVFGKDVITFEDLLAETGNFPQFREWLGKKFYNVDKNKIDTNKITPVGEFNVSREKNVITEITYELSPETSYKNYLLGLEGNTPKLKLRLPERQEATVDKMLKPQFLNRSLRYEIDSPVTTKEVSGTEGKVTESSVVEKTQEELAKEWEQFVQTSTTPEQEANIQKILEELEVQKDTSSLEDAKTEVTQTNDLTSQLNEVTKNLKKGKSLPNLNDESKTDGLFSAITETETDKGIDYEVVKSQFQAKFPGIQINEEGLRRLYGINASLKTATDAVVVSIDPTVPTHLWHEAFHIKNLLFNTPQQRAALYAELKQVLGEREVTIESGKYVDGEIVKSKVTVKGKDLTARQAEEYLAEEFRSFMMLGKDNYSFGPKEAMKQNIFTKMWNAIVDFLNRNFKLSINKVEAGKNPNLILREFDRINSGTFDINSVTINPGVYMFSVGNLSEGRTNALLNGLNRLFFEVGYRFIDGGASEVLGKLDTHIWDMYATTQELIKRQAEATGSEALQDILNNWDEFVLAHIKSLRQYKIQVDVFEDARQDENRSKENDGWFESNLVDPKAVMDNTFKLLLASLTDKNRKGEDIVLEGMKQSVNYGKLVNRLMIDLANVREFPDMVTKLKEKAMLYPVYDQLVANLKTDELGNTTSNNTDAEVALQNAFFFGLNKARTEYNSLIFGEKGNNYLVNSIEASTRTKVVEKWKNNIKMKSEASKGLFKEVDGRQVVDLEKGTVNLLGKNYLIKDIKQNTIRDLHNVEGTGKAYRDFLAAFGIELDSDIRFSDDMRIASGIIYTEVKEAIANKETLFADDFFNRDVVKINKEINNLAIEQANFEDGALTGQFINQDGQTEYSIRLKHDIDKRLEVIRDFKEGKISQLPDDLRPFDPETGEGNYMTYGSKWLTKDGPTIDGVIVREAGRERGEKSDFSDLKPGDHWAIQMQSVLEGINPFMRSADRKIETAFSLGKKSVSSKTPAQFVAELNHYLEAEIVYALAHISNPITNHFNRGAQDKGLSFFKNIVPEVNDILERNRDTYEELVPENLVDAAKAIVSANKDVINSRLNEYVVNYREDTKKELLRYRLFDKKGDNYISNALSPQVFSKGLGVKATTVEVDKVNLASLTPDALDRLIDTYNFYYTTSGIEQTKIITGSLNTYLKGAGFEFHKRTTLFTSTSSSSRSDAGYINWLNNRHTRFDGTQHTDRYKQLTIDDVNVKSKQFETFKALIGENKAAPYLSMTENDAATFMFLDGIKAFALRTSGRWTDNMERTYQREGQMLLQKFVELGLMTKEQYVERIGVYNAETGKGHLPSKVAPIDGKYFYKGQEIKVLTDGVFDLGIFNIEKPIARGTIANADLVQFGKKGLTKTSIAPVLPSDHTGNERMIRFMYDAMMNHGLDFIAPKSAEKGERVGNDKGELAKLYDKDGNLNTPSSLVEQGYMLTERYWKDIGKQLDLDPLGKEKATDSTQKRRLQYIDVFDNGNIREEYRDLLDSWNEYARLYNARIDQQIEKLVETLGLEPGAEAYSLKDLNKFVDIITDEFKTREMPDNAEDAVRMVFNEFNKNKLVDALPNKRQFVNLLQGLVRNKAVTLKVSGDMLVQQTVTGFETDVRNPEESNFLEFYRVVDGKVLPAEAMLSLPIKWIPFVENKYKGKTFEEKLTKFNEDIQDSSWDERLTFTANRIPGQHLNSIEVIRVKRFLSPFGGPRVVLPSEIVAKAGSDFDIDKLTTYFNNFRFVEDEPILIQYLDDSNSTIEERFEQNKNVQTTEMKNIYAEYKEKFEKIKATIQKSWEIHSGQLNKLIETKSLTEQQIDDLFYARKEKQIELSFLNTEFKDLELLYKDFERGFEETPAETGLTASMFGYGTDSMDVLMNIDEQIQNKQNEILEVEAVLESVESKIKSLSVNKLRRDDIKVKVDKRAARQVELLLEKDKLYNERDGKLLKLFSRLSIEMQNSAAAIENKLNELAQNVVLHPANFESLITPNSLGIIGELAKNRTVDAETKTTINNLLETGYNIRMAINQFQGKGGVGISANNTSAHALQQSNPIVFTSEAIQVLFDNFKSNTSPLYLGHVREADYGTHKGELISENNGSTVTAFVDAGSQAIPEIVKMNMTTSTANAYSVLNRIGSETHKPTNFRQIAELFTSPIVLAFERRMRTNESEFLRALDKQLSKKDVINSLLAVDGSKFYSEDVAKIKSKDRVYLYETMSDYIKRAMDLNTPNYVKNTYKQKVVNKLNEIKELPAGHHKNLEMFLYYLEVAKVINYVQQVTRPDAGLPKTRHEVKLLQRQLDRIKQSGLVDPAGIDNMLQNSYIAGFFKVHQESTKMFEEFHMSGISKEFHKLIWNDIADKMDNPLVARPREKAALAIMKLENSAINYILHNTKVGGKALNQRYGEIVKGANSLPMRLAKLKQQVKTDKKLAGLRNNPALLEFVPVSKEYNVYRDRRHETDYIKTFNRKYSVEESNALTRGLMELINHSDPTVAQIGNDLVDMALIQSGVMITPNSFFELIPASVYYSRVMNIFDNYLQDDNKTFVNNAIAKRYIYANLINDTTIVPRSKKGTFNSKTGTLFLPSTDQNSNYDYVSQYRKNNKGEYQLRLFEKRFDTENGASYQMIPIAGDYGRHYEAYSGYKKSGHVYNNTPYGLGEITTHTAPEVQKQVTAETPTDDLPKGEGLQMTSKPELKVDTQLNNAMRDFLAAIGVDYRSVNQIIDSNGKIWGDRANGAVAIASVIRKTVDVIEGRADKLTLPEEAAHMYVELLPTDHVLYKSMMGQIQKFEIYDEVAAEYGEALEDNIDRIKKEAIGKVIAHKLAGQPLNIKEQDTTANNWLRGLWSWVKSLFGKPSTDPFARVALDMMDRRVEHLLKLEQINLSETIEGLPEGESLRRVSDRLEVQDDVKAAQMAERRRVEAQQKQAELKAKLPESNEEVTKKNNEELSKISDRELAIQDIFRNFDTYFPDYSHWTSAEKLAFAESMDMLEIVC